MVLKAAASRIRVICSNGQHERGYLKRAHEARDVLYCAYEAHGAQKTVLRGSQATQAPAPHHWGGGTIDPSSVSLSEVRLGL